MTRIQNPELCIPHQTDRALLVVVGRQVLDAGELGTIEIITHQPFVIDPSDWLCSDWLDTDCLDTDWLGSGALDPRRN